MKNLKTILPILIIVFTLNNVVSAQNNTPTQGQKKVYHIKTWNHNNDLKNDMPKMNNAIAEIKNDILMSNDFIYFVELDNDEFLLVSNHSQNLHGKILQEKFHTYHIKINIVNVTEIEASSFGLATLPIYINQKTNSFKNQLLTWENGNQPTIENLKNLFQ